LLIKYIKSVLWRVVKRLSYIQDAWCLKVKLLLLLSNTAVTDITATTALPISVTCTNLSYWQCYTVNNKKLSN